MHGVCLTGKNLQSTETMSVKRFTKPQANARKRSNLCLICLVCIYAFFACTTPGCKKDRPMAIDSGNFMLTSPAVGSDSLLPRDYTCEGRSSTLPLAWSGAPDSTRSFVLVMHHEASLTDIHCYWIVYNIPSSLHFLPENMSETGTLGKNSVNDRQEYAPPCSQGPGPKQYILTLYALSRPVSLDVDGAEVDRPTILAAIKGITLDSAILAVYYTRTQL